MLIVAIKDGESIEKALKKYKKKFEKAKILLQLRERQSYTKPSVRRRGQVLKAVYKQQIASGKITGLIGPNGAGKTTVFNLLTKFLPPTRGSIHFNGHDITGEKPAQIARRGIIRSFQISATFPHLSVLENVRIGLQRHLGNSFHFWRSERVLDSLNGRAMQLLDTVGLTEFADTITVELSYGRKRALEIATTLAMEPELMLLDEPTQGMGHEDVDRVTDLIRKVSANRTILMVEHNMGVVAKIANTITLFIVIEILVVKFGFPPK